MRAYVLNEHLKSVEELPKHLVTDAPDPVPKANEVLIDVHSAALNFFDALQVQGKYQNQPPFPYSPGVEFSGVISATSPIPQGCPFKAGQTRVFGASQGSFAEKVSADFRQLIEIPDGLSFEQASGLFITYPTSYAGLITRANLKRDDWVLVHAAAGGVGLAAVQIAKALGAKVIATAGSAAKLEVAKKQGGADHALDYTKEGWQKEVLKLTKGKGVDIVYDPVGMILPSLKCIAWNGRAIVVGFAAGNIEKIPMNLVLLKNISLVGVHWGAYSKNEQGKIPEVWSALLELIRQGKLRPAVYDKQFVGLESVTAGLKALTNRETWGKAVVTVRQSKKQDSKL
ncbi:uncharacterized protein L969DRAFT_618571 [Mixia osmundae IAM 14324]|uniref:Enoyl reductase (ER) domain-containing protein n=1 Tax=Mixia osmundae (strain CBS 9802 / IAM 14324 / JCM 22182 / KY 12970) TaxID=764103 RepID=G7DUC1_MIXOS|nr:uncharacterized protein L969DRAFT_618571 [Mixia osmundae IAM 14324]KEI41053.1 hypothetical protein L969DRAFT_618571 [Mixia osmundae IAM 14324]GAA94181.1 hypothetical protein E5Q_00829 [Mixia osmundae IAM 14324]